MIQEQHSRETEIFKMLLDCTFPFYCWLKGPSWKQLGALAPGSSLGNHLVIAVFNF